MDDTQTKYWVRNASDEAAVKQGCYFDYRKADRVRKFFRKYIYHTEAPFAGQPFELLDWQWDKIIAPAFGWMMPDGTRRFRELEVWIPKKNGKSTLAAALSLYFMLADDEFGANVYSAASDRKQAGIIYKVAAAMVRMNPQLEEVLKVRNSVKKIICPSMNAMYEVLSAEGFRNQGYNIHALLFDELHTQRNRELWAALRYGTRARRQGMRVVISTAGDLDETLLWWERFNLAKDVQDSKVVNIGLLPCVYALEDNEDWHDEKVWERVNPSWHTTINQRDFRQDHEDATKNAAAEAEFLRYSLNKPTKFESAWIRSVYWVGCCIPQQPEQDEDYVPDEFVGVDLADAIDLNASVRGWQVKHPERGDCVMIDPMFWAPEEAGLAQNRQNRERYEMWFESGHLRCIPGPVALQNVIEDDIIRDIKGRNVREIGIDRFNAVQFAYSMQGKLKVAKCNETKLRLVGYNAPTCNEPVRLLEILITSGRLLHTGNPIMDWMFSNIQCVCDSSGNRKLDKAKSRGKIDGFAALVIAIYCMITQEPKPTSRYEDESPVSFNLWGSHEREEKSRRD